MHLVRMEVPGQGSRQSHFLMARNYAHQQQSQSYGSDRTRQSLPLLVKGSLTLPGPSCTDLRPRIEEKNTWTWGVTNRLGPSENSVSG